MKEPIENTPLFTKTNVQLLGAGIITIILGMILMSGGGSEDASFNPEIFSAQRVTVAPIVLLIGIGLLLVSIFYKGKPTK